MTDSSPPPADSLDVLIVDPSPECREVLRTLLESRGMRIDEAAEARRGLQMMERHCPDVVVLDADADAADDDEVQRLYRERMGRSGMALLVLGRARRLSECLPPERIVAKPYHYRPLIRTIEQLLSR